MTDHEELNIPIEIIVEEEDPELDSFFEESDDLDAKRRYLEGVQKAQEVVNSTLPVTIKSIGKTAIKDDQARFKPHRERRNYIE
jgi:hypothetical protein